MNARLKKIREMNKLSQEEFGKRINIESRGHISSLENGTKNITDRIVKDVCREFNINEDWLRTGDGVIKRNVDMEFSDICADIGVHDSKAKEAIMKYYELSDEDKKLWWNFMDKFLK